MSNPPPREIEAVAEAVAGWHVYDYDHANAWVMRNGSGVEQALGYRAAIKRMNELMAQAAIRALDAEREKDKRG